MLRGCPKHFVDDVIHGDRFAAIADVEINKHAKSPRFERNMARLGHGARVVFIKTDFVPEIFAWLRLVPRTEPFVLITHNSDFSVGKQLFESAPACVARWYTLNVKHAALNLIPIPSGMERPGGGGYSADYTQVPAAWQANPGGVRRHLAFGCWNDRNNSAERSPVRALFEGRPQIAWREHGISHQDFLRMCGESRFVISPPGNGIDCHRTWEAMYMGAISLVKRSHHTDGFEGLPMVAVDDWASLTDAALARVYDEYCEREWDHEKLFFQNRETLIRNDALALVD